MAHAGVETHRRSRFQSPSRGGHLRGGRSNARHRRCSSEFQSPSRGGHLRGRLQRRCRTQIVEFQSPSRGGHLRGLADARLRDARRVSVPFTRGTPPWPDAQDDVTAFDLCFSPLHEGDASVALPNGVCLCADTDVSVPFTRGTPPWPCVTGKGLALRRVSVPFTRGTPPWPRPDRPRRIFDTSFSPLHEGDTSVAGSRSGHPPPDISVSVPFTRGTPPWPPSSLPPAALSSFSPLPDGGTPP